MVDPARIVVAGHSDGAVISFGDGYQPFRLDPRVRAVVANAADLGPLGPLPAQRPADPACAERSRSCTTPYGAAIAWNRSTLQQPKTHAVTLERRARASVHEPR